VGELAIQMKDDRRKQESMKTERMKERKKQTNKETREGRKAKRTREQE